MHALRSPKGHRTATAGGTPSDALGDTAGPPQGAPWAPAADALDGARSRLLWSLALLMPYALAGALCAAVVAVGATLWIEPHGWTVGALWGSGVAVGLWLGRLPRLALILSALELVALATS